MFSERSLSEFLRETFFKPCVISPKWIFFSPHFFPHPSTLELLLCQTTFPGWRLLFWDSVEESLRTFDEKSSFQCSVYQITWFSLFKQIPKLNCCIEVLKLVCMHKKCTFLWLAENEREKRERRDDFGV